MFENAKDMRVRLVFVEDILGTSASDPELYRNYIASKAPDAQTREEQIAAIGVEEAIERGMTTFPKTANGEPILWPYQARGMFKAAQKSINAIKGKTAAGYVPNYKGKVDNMVFVKSVESEWCSHDNGIVIHMPIGKEFRSEVCERPLRADTMQGPRVSLARSETCPAGSWVEFDIRCLDPELLKNVRGWLDYGQYNGIGQWRNSGKGRFNWYLYVGARRYKMNYPQLSKYTKEDFLIMTLMSILVDFDFDGFFDNFGVVDDILKILPEPQQKEVIAKSEKEYADYIERAKDAKAREQIAKKAWEEYLDRVK